MLSELSAIVYIGLFYALLFPVGYLLLHLKDLGEFSALPFFMRFPVYLALGLSSSTVVYFFVGLIRVETYLPVILFLLTMFVILYRKARGILAAKTVTLRLSLDNVFPLVLFLVSFIHFSCVIGYMRWPPIGDILYEHGVTVSLFLLHKKVPFNYEPISPAPVTYPLGFHAAAAHLSMLTGLYPGEAIFLLGGAIVALIPSILYSLTYINTRSKTFSLLAYLSSYLIHPSGNMERWIVGYFYNGPYPNMYGFLSVFTFCALISLRRSSQINARNSKCFSFLLLLIALELLLVYPTFSVFILTYLIVVNIRVVSPGSIRRFWESVKPRFLTKKGVATTILLVLGLLLCCYVSQDQISYASRTVTRLIRSYIAMTFGKVYSCISSTFFYDSVIGLAILVATGVSIFFLVKKVYVDVSLFYLIVFVPLMLSLSDYIYPYMSLLLPARSIMINAGLSWVLISNFLHSSVRNLMGAKERTHIKIHSKRFVVKGVDSKLLANVVVLVLMLCFFHPTMTAHLSRAEAQGKKELLTFEPDREVLKWIDENVPPEDLILNDLSWSSYWLMSSSVKNLTFFFVRNRPYEEYVEIKRVWEMPEDRTFVRQVIEKYGVKYVFVTSEVGYYDWWAFGGDSRYKRKPYQPWEYVGVFDRYPFLEPVFRRGNNVVYRVVLSD